MTKKLSILLVTVCCALLSSCSIVTSNNGDLDGLWQMTLKEDLTTGEVTDMCDRNASWAVQGDLLMMRMDDVPEIVCRFNHQGDVLVVYEPYISDRYGESGTDIKVEDYSIVQPYGLTAQEEYFKVLELDSNTMRLESSKYRINLRKY